MTKPRQTRFVDSCAPEFDSLNLSKPSTEKRSIDNLPRKLSPRVFRLLGRVLSGCTTDYCSYQVTAYNPDIMTGLIQEKCFHISKENAFAGCLTGGWRFVNSTEKLVASKSRILLGALFFILTAGAFAQIPAGYFGMTMTATDSQEPYPSASIASIRLWNTGTDWADMNPAAGVYDFDRFDMWLSEAANHNLSVLYTFGRTPVWASSDPKMGCHGNPNGQCAPPKDLDPDGSGPDQLWKDFVTAIVNHNQQSPTGHVSYWEIWNEPNAIGNWKGTMAQTVRMAADAYNIIKKIDPSATVTSPAPTGEWMPDGKHTAVALWMQQFLAAGGLSYVDVFSFHTYVWQKNSLPVAEEVVPLIKSVKQVIASYHASSRPVWSTEGSYGAGVNGDQGLGDPDLRAAFTARFLLLQYSAGLQRFYWFAWDSIPPEGWGTMWTWDQSSGCTQPSGGGYLCGTGIAYQQLTDWMIGARLTQYCKQGTQTSQWTCQFSRSGGYVAEAIWDPAQTCKNGSCAVKWVSVPSQFISYRDIAGNKHSIGKGLAPVGAKPILLENQ